MHRILLVLAILTGILALGSPADAATFTPGPQLAASACGTDRSLVINVVEAVVDDRDDGVHGNVWASDSYMRMIQVWQTGADTFCATVRYAGSFVTIAGDSPGGTGSVAAGIRGVMHGGYRSTSFHATLLASPAWRTRGFVGVVDYGCHGTTTCPGRIDWVGQYFSGAGDFALAWWGWEYRAGSHGTWINAADGNSGDIN